MSHILYDTSNECKFDIQTTFAYEIFMFGALFLSEHKQSEI